LKLPIIRFPTLSKFVHIIVLSVLVEEVCLTKLIFSDVSFRCNLILILAKFGLFAFNGDQFPISVKWKQTKFIKLSCNALLSVLQNCQSIIISFICKTQASDYIKVL